MDGRTLQCLTNAILQQRSFNAVQLVDGIGLLVIDSVMEYNDYSMDKETRCRLIALGNNVFISVKEFIEKRMEIIVVASRLMKTFINVSCYQDGKLLYSIPSSKAIPGIVDLTTNGDRWEGYIWNNQPCGWGRLFNSNNTLVYEGFAYKGERTGYGTDFYPDAGDVVPAYTGSFCFGMRHGKGNVYTRTGVFVEETGWLYGRSSTSMSIQVPDHTESCMFHNTLMSAFIIGNHCYKQESSFILSGYPYLVTVRIGDDCYCEQGEHKHFMITNCDALQRLEIGIHSFVWFECCILKNLPSLQFCSFGNVGVESKCFYDCKELQLISFVC